MHTLRNLDPRLTFETFTVDEGNQFAHAAAIAVADRPCSYNPVYLFGDRPALGVTHLLHAITNQLRQNLPERSSIVFTTGEIFVNQLRSARRLSPKEQPPDQPFFPVLSEHQAHDGAYAYTEAVGAPPRGPAAVVPHVISDLGFLGEQPKTKPADFARPSADYYSADLLVIDDFQRIAVDAAEAFLDLFEHLFTRHSQIVIGADRSPASLARFSEPLAARMNFGIAADITTQQPATRATVLQNVAQNEGGIELPNDVAMFIATLKGDMRQQLGYLNRVIAMAMLTGKPVTLPQAKEDLHQVTKAGTIHPRDIIVVVAKHFALKISEIKSRSNEKHITVPRQIAMYLCKKLTDFSYPAIGKIFGGKHHSTVMYSVEKIDELRLRDPAISRQVSDLMVSLRPT